MNQNLFSFLIGCVYSRDGNRLLQTSFGFEAITMIAAKGDGVKTPWISKSTMPYHQGHIKYHA
jgi:hypothetical protein